MDQAYNPPELFICINCVSDKHLKKALQPQAGNIHKCSFCDKIGAVEFSELLDLLQDAIAFEYCDPVHVLFHDSSVNATPNPRLFAAAVADTNIPINS